MINRDEVRRIILSIIQPMYRGVFGGTTKLLAKLNDLVPFGSGDQFRHAQPYGLSGKPPNGVLAYYLNLAGKTQAPVIIAHLDELRPDPASPGDFILYCRDGSTFPVKVSFLTNGFYKVEASQEAQIISPVTRIGSAASDKNLVLGPELKDLLSNILEKISDLSDKVAGHKHLDGIFQIPTSVPVTASEFTDLKGGFDGYKASPVDDGAILSDVAFTEKGGA